ncbi:MAG TPA: hypothetical protein VHY09_14240 [Candidatus Methylacidiphilales bacterium]|jgi:hypothetical protein|nr:hypothetical protein [Candidatus Methylacidiphilales bacterium]
MKTFYLIKSLLPLLFLPVAPGVLQLELARQGLLTGSWAGYVIAAQGIFTLGIIAWLGLSITRQRQKAFLRMSCVSKKVYFQGRWMTVESYLAEQHNIEVSHAMTPEESQAWLADAEDYLRQEIPAPEADQTCALPEVVAEASRHLHESAA